MKNRKLHRNFTLGCIKRGGGAYKILPRGDLKYTPPPPSPEKCLMARNGGGGYVISPWIEESMWATVRLLPAHDAHRLLSEGPALLGHYRMLKFQRMQPFCLQLEASCLQWRFLLTADNFSYFTYNWSFFTYSSSFLLTTGAFLLTMGKYV